LGGIKTTSSKQYDVYNYCGRPIVWSSVEGFNGTIFAYGQTGTGKTFTMEGVLTNNNNNIKEKGNQDGKEGKEGKERREGKVEEEQDLRGIIPNTFNHLFSSIGVSGEEKNFLIRASFLEIYNEEIRDLLIVDPRHLLSPCDLREDTGYYSIHFFLWIFLDLFYFFFFFQLILTFIPITAIYSGCGVCREPYADSGERRGRYYQSDGAGEDKQNSRRHRNECPVF
jgi:hypothetical protein